MAASLMSQKQKPVLRVVHRIFLVVALGYLMWMISAHAGDSWRVLQSMAPLPLLAAIFLGMVMTGASALVFALLAQPDSKNVAKVMFVAEVFLLGQAIKYLPGRIWGTVYQVQRLANLIPRAQTTLAAISHMLLGGGVGVFSLAVALAITKLNPVATLTLLVLFEVLIFLWIRNGMITHLIQMLIPKAFKSAVNVIDHPRSTRSAAQVVVMLNVEWAMYFIFWQVLAASMNLPDTIDVFVLASLYAGACLIGYLAVIFPAGLGVREGTFIALATGLGYPVDQTLALAAAARFVLTLSEAFMSLLVVPLGQFFGSHEVNQD